MIRRNRQQPQSPTRTQASRSRAVYAGLLALTIIAGLWSRRAPMLQPDWMARYAGDVLWASMVFWILALVSPRAQTVIIGAIALGFAWAVELSQLWRLPWLDAVRSSRVGALVLGQGFLWSDLLCYIVGVAIASAGDQALRGLSRTGSKGQVNQ